MLQFPGLQACTSAPNFLINHAHEKSAQHTNGTTIAFSANEIFTGLHTVGYSIKTKYCLEELAVSGCLGWPEFSSSIFNALFNQIQEVH